MTMTDQHDPLAFDRRYSIASLAAARVRIASALALPCAVHDAEPGAHCWGSPRTLVRGLCLDRFQNGMRHTVRASTVPVTPGSDPRTGTSTSETRTRLEFRHPNRHPITPIRAAVAR